MFFAAETIDNFHIHSAYEWQFEFYFLTGDFSRVLNILYNFANPDQGRTRKGERQG